MRIVDSLNPLIDRFINRYLLRRTTMRTIAIPARAMAHSDAAAVTPYTYGIEWGAASLSVTVPAPKDYAGGTVVFRAFFRFGGAGEEGTFNIAVTPMAYSSGNDLETYSSYSTPTMSSTGNINNMYELSLDIIPEYWGTGDWWFFRVSRGGTFPANIRLMSIGLDYRAHVLK
jgi:hypothetical protein